MSTLAAAGAGERMMAAGLWSTWWQYLVLFLAVAVTPAIVTGTAKMPPYQFAVWNLLASLGWTVSVAASAYGIGRLATGHQAWRDIAVLVIGLGVGVLFTVVVVRRHRRQQARRPRAVAHQAPGDSS